MSRTRHGPQYCSKSGSADCPACKPRPRRSERGEIAEQLADLDGPLKNYPFRCCAECGC